MVPLQPDRALRPPPALVVLLAALASILAGVAPAGAQATAPTTGARLDALDLDVDIQDSVAVTRASLTVTNPMAAAQELDVELPLGPSAVLTAFSLTTANDTLQGVVLQRSQAQAAYNASRSAGLDAVLLRSAGKGRLSLSLNVAAASTVRLNATYAEILPLAQSVQTYRFPWDALAARYGPAGVARLHVGAASAPGWTQVSATGVGAQPVAPDPHHATLDHAAEAFRPQAPLEIRLRPDAARFASALVLSGLRDNASLLFTLLPAGFANASIPLDVVFVLDHSGSMSGDKIDQAKRALSTILGQLRAEDRFGLVRFDDTVSVWKPDLRPATGPEVTGARGWVSDIRADGATNIEGALASALALLPAPATAALPTVVLITDGLPTAGVTSLPAIVDSARSHNTMGARLHTVGIGFDQDNAFLAELAAASRGFYQAVPPEASVETVLNDFYARIAAPVVRDVNVTVDGLAVTETHPQPLPDLYRGSHLVVAARADARNLPSPLAVHVTGRDAHGPVAYDLEVDTGGVAVRPEADRLWARQKANSLERAIELSTDPARATLQRAELLRVGLEQQIETLETAWVIVKVDVPTLPTPTGQPGVTLPVTTAPLDALAGRAPPAGSIGAGGGGGSAVKKTPAPHALAALEAALAAIAIAGRRRRG